MAGQASFSFPPARPRSQGTNRPQPQRLNSNNPRTATPYQRPTSSSSSIAPPPPPSSSSSSSSGKWQHDLFGESSDLYRPSVNVQHLSRIIPGATPIPSQQSASLRPFGDATPAPQRLISTPSNPLPPSQVPAQQNPDLFTRLGIKGSSSQAQLQQQQQQERERLRFEKSEKVRLERERRELVRVRKEQEKEYAEKLGIAEQEETGFVVQVEGLVFGTSGEDVQTAFASYGEIKHCFIVDEKSAREGDQLIARITFSKHDEAKTACHKLDGAIADGRPLRVQNVPRSPFPKPLPPFEHSLNSSSSAPASPSTSSAVLPTGPRGARGGISKMGPSRTSNVTPPTPPLQTSIPTPIPSKMYADVVESHSLAPPPARDSMMDLDPPPLSSSSSTSYAPSVPQVAPTGPRRGGHQALRGGRGGAGMRPGPPVGLSARVQPTGVQANGQGGGGGGSLLDRVNGGAGAKKVGNVNGQTQGKSLSLVERMGQVGSAQGQGQGKKGTQGGKMGGNGKGGAGGSLLDRLK